MDMVCRIAREGYVTTYDYTTLPLPRPCRLLQHTTSACLRRQAINVWMRRARA